MDTITRKRKLHEIDKNIPFFPSSTTKQELTQHIENSNINAIKPQKPKTPLIRCENNVQHLPKDVEEFENPRFQKSNGRKAEGRHPMKSCDRKYRKSILLNKSTEFKQLNISVDNVSTISENINDLSKYDRTIIPDQENLLSHYNLVNETETRETKMWFACEYFEDILAYELQKEKRHKLSQTFCKRYDVNPIRREILIDWLISVQIYLKANNNSLHLAISLLDILLDRIYIPNDYLQVSAIAAFWVAYKVIHGNLSVKTLLSLCPGKTKDMILDHEVLVLEASRLLQVGGDICTFFNYLLFKLFGSSYPPEIYYCGQFFLEIMMMQFIFIEYSGCEKAITAVYAAVAIFDSSQRFNLYDFSSFITKNTLKLMCSHLMRHLKNMYSDEELCKSSSLFRKYKLARYYKISNHEILKNLRLLKSYSFLCSF